MKNGSTFALITAAAVLMGTSAMAETSLTGVTELNDRLADIETEVSDDQARSIDAARFGNPEFRPGMSGSASVGYSGKTGNSESQDFSAGARLRYAAGPLVQTIGLAIDYSEATGAATQEDVFAVYDANYYFNDSLYGFVLGRMEHDGLATAAADVKNDAFLGFGPGYRILNSEKMTWRMQAGVGVSYVEQGDGASETNTAAIVSSRLFYAFNENVFLTNDTDVLKSSTSLRVNNDLGLNLKMTDSFSTRVSYLTEYNDSRAIRSDNKLGVSLVYGF